jgi:multidrug efflux pump subunit AcrA (membrane-fusion protein)
MNLASVTPAATVPIAPPAARPRTKRRDEPARPKTRRLGRLIAILVLIMSLGIVVGLKSRGHDTRPHDGLEIEVVQRGELPMEIVTRGDLEPSEAVDLVCRVKALGNSAFSATIKWVAEQGSQVKRGDPVVLLDDAPYREDLALRRVPLEQARADWLLADEYKKIVVIQGEADIAAAENAFRLARIDLRKYVEADRGVARDDLLGRLKLAESDLLASREHLAFAERMRRRGFISEAQARAERNRTEATQLGVDLLREQLDVLDKYTNPRVLTELEAKVAETRRAVAVAKEQAKCKEIQADTDCLSKQRIYQRRLTRYHEIEAEAAKCRITAPHDGMVVYFTSEQARNGVGSNQFVLAEGEQVHEGQVLARLVQLQHMVVRTWVHEALIGRVHGEDEVVSRSQFQPALIRLDAMPDRILHGHVKLVGAVPWMINGRMDGTKAFRTTLVIDDPVDGLRPDMSAQVTIELQEAPHDAITVPLDAILPGLGNHRKLYVLGDEGPREPNFRSWATE